MMHIVNNMLSGCHSQGRVVTTREAASPVPADVVPLTVTVCVVAGSRPPSGSLVSADTLVMNGRKPEACTSIV